MGILEPERTDTEPHPRKEPRFDGPLTLESLGRVFEGCVDYMERQVYLHGDRERTVTVCYLLGMTRNERLSDYILRPLAQDPALSRAPEEELFSLLQYGALYNLAANRRTALEDVVNDLILGSCALFFPGRADALTLPVPTEEKRSVGEPENEPALKGVRESFVESIRTNTAPSPFSRRRPPGPSPTGCSSSIWPGRWAWPCGTWGAPCFCPSGSPGASRWRAPGGRPSTLWPSGTSCPAPGAWWSAAGSAAPS